MDIKTFYSQLPPLPQDSEIHDARAENYNFKGYLVDAISLDDSKATLFLHEGGSLVANIYDSVEPAVHPRKPFPTGRLNEQKEQR